jgi:hypothetical protein
MSVYKYIAEINPFEANDLCVQNGMQDALTLDELSNNLALIVANEGEIGFKNVMDLHPDKQVILELFQPKNSKKDDIFEVVRPPQMVQQQPQAQPIYLNATGTQPSQIVSSTSTMILVAALIVSIAIVSIKK